MKKFTKIAVVMLILTLLVTLTAALAACGGSVDEISLKDAPRLTYVQGQELDLSKGTLLVVSGGKQSEVALTSKSVKISGSTE